MKHKYKISLLGILFFILISTLYSFKLDIETTFTEEEMLEINEEVDRRVSAFVVKKKRDCRKELMEMVEDRVDSILMFDIKELLILDGEIQDDTPERPLPPEKPEILEPNDDTPLQPLIENEAEVFNTTNKIE